MGRIYGLHSGSNKPSAQLARSIMWYSRQNKGGNKRTYFTASNGLSYPVDILNEYLPFKRLEAIRRVSSGAMVSLEKAQLLVEEFMKEKFSWIKVAGTIKIDNTFSFGGITMDMTEIEDKCLPLSMHINRSEAARKVMDKCKVSFKDAEAFINAYSEQEVRGDIYYVDDAGNRLPDDAEKKIEDAENKKNGIIGFIIMAIIMLPFFILLFMSIVM